MYRNSLRQITTAATVLAASLTPALASARALLFDQDVAPAVIMGSGIANGGFTVDRTNKIELGLRARLRYDDDGNPTNTVNSNGDGSYTYRARSAFPDDPLKKLLAEWNIDWSVNVGLGTDSQQVLNQLTYVFGVDVDPTAGVENWVTGDAINLTELDPSDRCTDTSFGTSTTGAGEGVEVSSAACLLPAGRAQYATYLDTMSVAQNSWNPGLLNRIDGVSFDPTVAGEYKFYIEAIGPEGGSALARTEITVTTTSVPEPGPMALIGLGLAGIGWFRRRDSR